jgi:hypothetical protein
MSEHSTNGAAAGDFEEVTSTEAASAKSFEEQVNAAVSTMVEDDGVWKLPEDVDLPEEVAFAANLEKRRRDTQSAFAKTSQERDALRDRSSKLESKLKEVYAPQLTEAQEEELDDLKTSDPEAWRQKLDEYENAALETFESELADLGYDDETIDELATRSVQLSEFLEANPGLTLNDDVFENDLPPRITGKLQSGEINFEEFLNEAKTFLKAGKKLAGSKEEGNEPDLGKAGGSSEASPAAIAGDSEASYKNEIY